MRRRNTNPRVFLALLSLWALAPLSAQAQSEPFRRSFDLLPLRPTPSPYGGIALDGARLLGRGGLSLEVTLDAALGLMSLEIGGEPLGSLIPARLDGHLQLVYGLHPRVELAADLPLTLLQGDRFGLLADEGLPLPGVAALGPGDVRLIARGLLLERRAAAFRLSTGLELRFPTGDGASFLGDRAMTFVPTLSAEATLAGVRLLGSLGGRFRAGYGQFLNLYVGHELTAGLGGAIPLFPLGPLRDPTLMVEVHGATPLEAPFGLGAGDSLKPALNLLFGLRGGLTERLQLGLHVGRGIGGAGFGQPAFRALAQLRWTFDDGDDDDDGVANDVDLCALSPEDPDGFGDLDGCAEGDNDLDGLEDAHDLCPDEPGPLELDGCPDFDLDEIPDILDRCPELPGPPDNEGCPYDEPEVVLESDRIRVEGNILFETGSTRIQAQSFKMLDRVFQVLDENPDVGPVQVEGHTDSVGSARYNLRLSQQRSKAVVDYLIEKGISPARLSYRGFGEERPVAPNDTALGRAKNRRVDFNLRGGGALDLDDDT